MAHGRHLAAGRSQHAGGGPDSPHRGGAPQWRRDSPRFWIPAFAGMTGEELDPCFRRDDELKIKKGLAQSLTRPRRMSANITQSPTNEYNGCWKVAGRLCSKKKWPTH